METFLGYNDVVQTHSTWNKGSLHWGDKVGQEGSKFSNYNLRDDLISCITQTYRPEATKSISSCVFGNESYQGFINVLWYLTINKGPFYCICNCSYNKQPKLLKKTNV